MLPRADHYIQHCNRTGVPCLPVLITTYSTVVEQVYRALNYISLVISISVFIVFGCTAKALAQHSYRVQYMGLEYICGI